MSPSKAEEVVQHIHPLTKVDGVGRYICDGSRAPVNPRQTWVRHLRRNDRRVVLPMRALRLRREVQELIEVQELGEFQELGEVQELGEFQEPREVQEPCEVQEPDEVEEPDPDRLRKRDVMYIGARVAWACMTGDVAGVISAFQL
ncbi:BnaA04g21610D [Brassica napus]|uniref:BnaA04g21610D protein n=1 Tax=Brassica napus TaxID=3708 RepID=A0A078FZF1_BRANA|nr:BnaA04g21610D [Brassica napus]